MRLRVRTVLILLLTLGLLAFSFRGTNVAGVWAEARGADRGLLGIAVIVTALTYAVRAWRWQSLLAPIGTTRFVNAFSTTVIGFAANSLLPARAGEVIRPYLLARREHLNASSAFATIVLERLLDLATVLLLFAGFVLTLGPGVISGDPAQLARVKGGGLVAAAAALGAIGVLFALAGHPERLGRAALRIERVLPARLATMVAGFVETFAQGLAVMRDPARLFAALALSFPMWMSIAAGIWLTSRAFHIIFPYPASFLVMTILVVGVAAPTPGAIGAFHAAYIFAVTTFFGVSPDRAGAAALLLHAISFVPVTILGVIFMAREGLTLSSARKLAGENGTRAPDGSEAAGGAPSVTEDAAPRVVRLEKGAP
ncbi:MAG: lysylphosphatidylglycerol synthase transmembrane domain-containing protein [Acidobacteriota bacterium]